MMSAMSMQVRRGGKPKLAVVAGTAVAGAAGAVRCLCDDAQTPPEITTTLAADH